MTLVKKFFIYKMMASNLFINHSLTGMMLAYKMLGKKFTNVLIEQSCGSIFTGGVTLKDLIRDTNELEEQKIGGIGCYVVEGLRHIENSKLDKFYDFCW